MARARSDGKRAETPWEGPAPASDGSAEITAELTGAAAQQAGPREFGVNLKRARTAMGLSLDELAARVNIRQAALEAYESGRMWPPLIHGQLLADALATRIPVLLGLEAPAKGQPPRERGRLSAEALATITEQTAELTTLKRTLEVTRASEKRWMGLAEAVTEGVLLHDGKVVRDVNPRFVELFGYDRAKVIGRPIMDFIAPESRPQVAKAVRAGATAPYEMVGVRQDGSPLRMVVTPRRMANGMRIAAFRVVLPERL